MVVVRILGGLGNQLFQYAAGYALARQNQTELKLDLSSLAGNGLRTFELHRMNATYEVATEAELKSVKANNAWQRTAARLRPAAQKRFYKQPAFGFDPAFFSLRSPVYIQGYFQSERFFAPVKDHLREAFGFKEPLRKEVVKMGIRLRDTCSVAVHIRRGDYQSNQALRVHGVLPPEYYRMATQRLREMHGPAIQFYVFSDSPVSAHQKAFTKDTQTVSGLLTTNHLEDFYLMQHCRHNIIANSSFSWWAAWLNGYAEKTVVAPRQWFNQGPKDTQDLLPVDWICL